MSLTADDLGNHETEYKIFLAPSASATDSPATGCNILPTDPWSGSLAVVNETLLYSDNDCWSSTYGSKGISLIFESQTDVWNLNVSKWTVKFGPDFVNISPLKLHRNYQILS